MDWTEFASSIALVWVLNVVVVAGEEEVPVLSPSVRYNRRYQALTGDGESFP